MKRFSLIINFLLLLNIAGCSTIYGVAVEERKASTIAADTKITTTIQARFVEDNEVKALDISPFCYNGNVYLVGEYAKESQKERAISIAKAVEGVRSVHTYILPKKKDDRCGTAKNLEIRGKVDARLVADKDIWSTNIDVKVVQCNVVLLGIVKSGKEITRAVTHATNVEGVRGVKSYLRSTR